MGEADLGLGGFIQSVLAEPGKYPEALVTEIKDGDGADANMGKHKVSTLRNIELTPPYGHNGFFPNLTSIVQFYNTRDPLACSLVGGIPVTPALLADGKIPGYNGNAEYCWPAPEIAANVNDVELGDLGLTSDQVDSIKTGGVEFGSWLKYPTKPELFKVMKFKISSISVFRAWQTITSIAGGCLMPLCGSAAHQPINNPSFIRHFMTSVTPDEIAFGIGHGLVFDPKGSGSRYLCQRGARQILSNNEDAESSSLS